MRIVIIVSASSTITKNFLIYPYLLLLLDEDLTCLNPVSFIGFGETKYIPTSYHYLIICFPWPKKTNVSAWIDNEPGKVISQSDRGIVYKYLIKKDVYRFNVVIEAKTEKNVTVQTYVRIVYTGMKELISLFLFIYCSCFCTFNFCRRSSTCIRRSF